MKSFDDASKEETNELINYYIQSDDDSHQDSFYDDLFIDETNLYIEENVMTGQFQETLINCCKNLPSKNPRIDKLFKN